MLEDSYLTASFLAVLIHNIDDGHQFIAAWLEKPAGAVSTGAIST